MTRKEIITLVYFFAASVLLTTGLMTIWFMIFVFGDGQLNMQLLDYLTLLFGFVSFVAGGFMMFKSLINSYAIIIKRERE